MPILFWRSSSSIFDRVNFYFNRFGVYIPFGEYLKNKMLHKILKITNLAQNKFSNAKVQHQHIITLKGLTKIIMVLPLLA